LQEGGIGIDIGSGVFSRRKIVDGFARITVGLRFKGSKAMKKQA